jgi:hypothetical protein
VSPWSRARPRRAGRDPAERGASPRSRALPCGAGRFPAERGASLRSGPCPRGSGRNPAERAASPRSEARPHEAGRVPAERGAYPRSGARPRGAHFHVDPENELNFYICMDVQNTGVDIFYKTLNYSQMLFQNTLWGGTYRQVDYNQ